MLYDPFYNTDSEVNLIVVMMLIKCWTKDITINVTSYLTYSRSCALVF